MIPQDVHIALAPEHGRELADALPNFDVEVGEHDARLEALALVVWVGSKPTFTDRHAQSPEWLSMALGGDKEVVAGRRPAGLCRTWPGGVVLRSEGRHYPGEAQPRWNIGHLRRRDGLSLWDGPPDPIQGRPDPGTAVLPSLDGWAAALATHLVQADSGPARARSTALSSKIGRLRWPATAPLRSSSRIGKTRRTLVGAHTLPPLATRTSSWTHCRRSRRPPATADCRRWCWPAATPPVDASVKLHHRRHPIRR